jgi:hypothetical protein
MTAADEGIAGNAWVTASVLPSFVSAAWAGGRTVKSG